MNAKLDKQLTKDFPLAFRRRRLSAMQACMGRGFTCDDGWHEIIRDVAHLIEQDIKDTHYSKNAPACVSQVKEKFGMLRIYLDNGNDYLTGVVAMAEVLSARTCEVCGTTKDVKRHKLFGFYLKTVCPKCKKALEKKHKAL